MSKRILSFLVSMIVLASVVAGCGSVTTDDARTVASSTVIEKNDGTGSTPAKEKKYAKHYKVSASCVMLEAGADYSSDPLMKFFEDKYNFSFNLIPLSSADWVEKTRVWIASGNMPDMTFFNIGFRDYANYAKQGLLKEIPADYEIKYPYLASAMAKTKIDAYAKKQMDGKLYMIPKVAFYDIPADTISTHFALWYRKDWAQTLGIQVKDHKITFDQIAAMSKAFQRQDPGGNGPGNTVGVVADPGYALDIILPHNLDYNVFHLVDGKYVWGSQEQGMLKGLKELQQWYRDGVLYKDYYMFKSGEDAKQLFYSGKSGIFMDLCPYGEINRKFSEFSAANPGKNPDDCIGLAVWTSSRDNKHYGTEEANFWASTVFNPNIEDEKFARILEMMDYVASPEGQNRIQLGEEGKEYRKENGKIVLTREKDVNGNFKPMQDLHKSFFFFAMMSILWDNFGVNDPGTPENRRQIVTDLYKARAEGVLRRLDFFRDYFSAPNYDKFQVQYTDELTQLILKQGDLEKNWKEWVASRKALADACAKELNDAAAKMK